MAAQAPPGAEQARKDQMAGRDARPEPKDTSGATGGLPGGGDGPASVPLPNADQVNATIDAAETPPEPTTPAPVPVGGEESMSDEQLDQAIDSLEQSGHPDASKLRRELANRRVKLREYEEAFGDHSFADTLGTMNPQDQRVFLQLAAQIGSGDVGNAAEWMLTNGKTLYENYVRANPQARPLADELRELGYDMAAAPEPAAPVAPAPGEDGGPDLYDPEQMAAYIQEKIAEGISSGMGEATQKFDQRQKQAASAARLRQLGSQLDTALGEKGYATQTTQNPQTGQRYYTDERTAMLMSLVRLNPSGDPRQDVEMADRVLRTQLGETAEPATTGPASVPQPPPEGAAPPQVPSEATAEERMAARLDSVYGPDMGRR